MIIVKEFLLKKLLKVVFEMNLDEILEQIILDSENYNKFLKLQDEKQVYSFYVKNMIITKISRIFVI